MTDEGLESQSDLFVSVLTTLEVSGLRPKSHSE